MKGNEQTAIIEEAHKVEIIHFQEEYGLEVRITKQEMPPTYVASQVNMEGHVVGEGEQRFNISVNYKDWTTMNTFLSPELRMMRLIPKKIRFIKWSISFEQHNWN